MSELLPPEHLNRLVGGKTLADYREIGAHFLEVFIKYGSLKPGDRLLDVGCGCGRMAVPLTTYLTTGAYEGFDVVKESIDWCQKNITPRLPNFHFQWADIYNSEYNRNSKTRAQDYRFPYSDDSFDFIFLTSVFTHMFQEDTEHYLHEISRVMKPAATALMTFFLWNDEADRLHRYDACQVKFPYKWGKRGMRVGSKKHPEAVVAYPEPLIRELLEQTGLQLAAPIHFGSWAGRQNTVTFQDLVLARKK